MAGWQERADGAMTRRERDGVWKLAELSRSGWVLSFNDEPVDSGLDRTGAFPTMAAAMAVAAAHDETRN